MRRLVDEGVRARVTFFVVEAGRLNAKHPYIPDAEFDAYLLPEGNSVKIAINSADSIVPVLDGRLPPSSLANPTGGKAGRNILSLGRVLTAASQSLRGYYVIGYSPPGSDPEEGRRRVRIQVNRPGLTLVYPEL